MAHTTKQTASTMDMMRSTSPPKSEWPGVSTMLILWPPKVTLVHFERIVIPRSYSSTFESIARYSVKLIPLYLSRQSTNVVLPWSTCAMMATFLIFWGLFSSSSSFSALLISKAEKEREGMKREPSKIGLGWLISLSPWRKKGWALRSENITSGSN